MTDTAVLKSSNKRAFHLKSNPTLFLDIIGKTLCKSLNMIFFRELWGFNMCRRDDVIWYLQ